MDIRTPIGEFASFQTPDNAVNYLPEVVDIKDSETGRMPDRIQIRFSLAKTLSPGNLEFWFEMRPNASAAWATVLSWQALGLFSTSSGKATVSADTDGASPVFIPEGAQIRIGTDTSGCDASNYWTCDFEVQRFFDV